MTDEEKRELVGMFTAFTKEARGPDLILHPIAFGGVAFQPMTEAGADWLVRAEIAHFDRSFVAGFDACMDFAPRDSVGFEPQDAEGLIVNALESGLEVKREG